MHFSHQDSVLLNSDDCQEQYRIIQCDTTQWNYSTTGPVQYNYNAMHLELSTVHSDLSAMYAVPSYSAKHFDLNANLSTIHYSELHFISISMHFDHSFDGLRPRLMQFDLSLMYSDQGWMHSDHRLMYFDHSLINFDHSLMNFDHSFDEL